MRCSRSAQRLVGPPHMPKKKSIKGSANEFKAETDKILVFLTA